MASFEQRGNSVRAIVSFPDGKKTKTFDKWGEARAWAAMTERNKKLGTVATSKRRTVEDLFLAYLPSAEATDSAKWNRLRIMKFCNDPLGRVLLNEVSPHDIELWIARRLQDVKTSTVRRELALMSAAFTYGLTVRKWITENPCTPVKKPAKIRARHRPLLTKPEIDAIAVATGYANDPRLTTIIARVGACFFLSMETGMRSGEILRIRPHDYNRDARVVYVHALERGGRKGSRSGELSADRYVPLTQQAIYLLDQLLATMPPNQVPRPEMNMPPYIVGVNDSQRDILWRKARDRSGVTNLTFHDMKHEAATRLARHIDVIALSHALGTKDLKLLRDTYYNDDANRIAMSLPERLNDYDGTLIRRNLIGDHYPQARALHERSSVRMQPAI
ncbi:tyrosine-type recombinase/integrase [Pollutimonas bauzanensis]|uniref:Site-specific recombinase XerD n=1 Tax=Pollutimonas bauzanensis TaxID=658167 RepID=A0A1M5YHM2_9BURK|nr:tyrosine-type recombinase/integrase [Pollutimonas bauzanensis]SHI11379.1 Site-specific recombinase XerD [Pollutimonas bauzanensis]